MLYDEHLEYERISEDEYNFILEDIANGDAKLVNSIVVFGKNLKTNEIKKFEISAEKNNMKNCNLDEWKILVKYYLKRIKQNNIYKFNCQEVGEAYYIYGLGYFYISDFYKDMKPKLNEEIRDLFIEYDKNYHIMTFPFSDEDFIISKGLQK